VPLPLPLPHVTPSISPIFSAILALLMANSREKWPKVFCFRRGCPAVPGGLDSVVEECKMLLDRPIEHTHPMGRASIWPRRQAKAQQARRPPFCAKERRPLAAAG